MLRSNLRHASFGGTERVLSIAHLVGIGGCGAREGQRASGQNAREQQRRYVGKGFDINRFRRFSLRRQPRSMRH